MCYIRNGKEIFKKGHYKIPLVDLVSTSVQPKTSSKWYEMNLQLKRNKLIFYYFMKRIFHCSDIKASGSWNDFLMC